MKACCHPVAIAQGGRALTAKVRGPRFNPGWLPVFHSFLKIFPSLSSCMRMLVVKSPVHTPSVTAGSCGHSYIQLTLK